jgi:hypothetical protein
MRGNRITSCNETFSLRSSARHLRPLSNQIRAVEIAATVRNRGCLRQDAPFAAALVRATRAQRNMTFCRRAADARRTNARANADAIDLFQAMARKIEPV